MPTDPFRPDHHRAPLRASGRRPWYATDSGRVGVALTGVTLLVLGVGLGVIHGARPADNAPPTPSPADAVTGAAPDPSPAGRRSWIVLRGSAPDAAPLPPPTAPAERVAERAPTTPPTR